MPYQRPFFAFFAFLYCAALGIFSLSHTPSSRLNKSFAYFNFSNAIWNLSEFTVLIPNYNMALFFLRITGIGGCIAIPFVMEFIFRVVGVFERPVFKTIQNVFLAIGILLSILHLTPWMFIGIAIQPLAGMYTLEIPGPLYPIFCIYLVLGLFFIIFPIKSQMKKAQGFQKKQMLYCVLACSFGVMALIAFYASFFSYDLPWLYYPLQALVSSIFAYAIFKDNLLSIRIAIRRGVLFSGIYILMGMILVPVIYFYTHYVLKAGTSIFPSILIPFFLAGGFLSVGPFIYAAMVRKSSLFQDTTASHLTHELKTPLHAIQNAKDILEQELSKTNPDQLKVHDYMQMIDRNTDRLQKFVSEILTTMKSEEANVSLQKENCDLYELTQTALAQFPQLASRIKMEGERSLKVRLDREAILQVISNLLSNAAKHAPEGPILIRLSSNADQAEVSVQDFGNGIALSDLNHVFKPFAQSGDNVNRAKGTGLGLAIAKKWVEAHQGKIWAESKGEGEGAKFTFLLPKN